MGVLEENTATDLWFKTYFVFFSILLQISLVSTLAWFAMRLWKQYRYWNRWYPLRGCIVFWCTHRAFCTLRYITCLLSQWDILYAYLIAHTSQNPQLDTVSINTLQKAVFTSDAGLLLARSQYSEGPATGQLDTGFSRFPCVYKQMLRRFPTFQVATTCFSCNPPDLNLLVTNFMFYLHVK